MRASDNYLVNVLAALKSVTTSSGSSLYDDTLVIRTSDHGEMGLAHGGLRQKNFNFYEESLRVPLVYSNPKLFARPRRSSAMVSHVDFLPTLASLFAAPPERPLRLAGPSTTRRSCWAARPRPCRTTSSSPTTTTSPGRPNGPYVPPPQHIVSIRETRWKIAQYYDTAGTVPSEWEMYDLQTDPLETINLARPGYRRTSAENAQYARLRRKLAEVQATRLQPL